MPARRANWLNLHSTRRYPLDDNATGTGDDGERLKDDILADCHIRFPNTAGAYLFLSGINVTDKIVTLVFMAADSTTSASYVPAASISLAQPVEAGINYPVSPLLDGVGGFVVFGDVSETFVGRFSTPAQGLLSLKCARPYKPLPIPTIRSMGRDIGLQGIVTLKAGNDIEIVAEQMDPTYFDSPDVTSTVDTIVIRLRQPPGEDSVLARYIGPCDSRPESRNCLKEGIEAINEALPDCDGNIEIVFQSLTEGLYESCGGTTIDHNINITEACAPRVPEQFAGRDLCYPSSSSSSSSSSVGGPAPFTMAPAMAAPIRTESQFLLNFDDEASLDFVHTVTGSGWQRVLDEDAATGLDNLPTESEEPEPYQENSPHSLAAYDLSRRSVAIVNYGGNVGTQNAVNQEVVTDLRFDAHNPLDACAGLIANYRTVNVLANPHVEYIYAEVNKKTRRLVLWFFAGQGAYTRLGEARFRDAVIADHWYRLKLEITAHAVWPDMVNVTALLTGVSNPSWSPIKLQLTTNQYLPADGDYGLCAVRTNAAFAYLNARDI